MLTRYLGQGRLALHTVMQERSSGCELCFCTGQADYEKERFKLPATVLEAARKDGGPEPLKKRRRMGGSTATQHEEEDDKEHLVLWRVNRDEFNKRLRLVIAQDMTRSAYRGCISNIVEQPVTPT